MLRSRIVRGLIALGAAAGLTLLTLDATVFAPVDVQAPPTPAVASPASENGAPTDAATEVADASLRLFRIDPAQSEVRYEVGETFFSENNRFAIAVGRTSGISGEILVDLDEPAASRVGEIVIDVSQFTSDELRRDNYIRRSGLESARFPLARFVPTAVEGLPASIPPGEEVAFTIRGDLTVKEVTRPAEWQVTARLESDRLIGRAEGEILMSDFGVGPIRIPFLATEDEVTLVLEFVAVAP
ncbi:MAG: YceI family protein [Anaerolineales bacterium]